MNLLNNYDFVKRDLIHLMKNRRKLSGDQFRDVLHKILGRSDLAWELGPDPLDEQHDVLSLSLMSNREYVCEIAVGLELPFKGENWSIQVGIPPRGWEKYFEFTASDGCKIAIEGEKWHFNIVKNNLRAKIYLSPESSFPCAYFSSIARILIVGELGEQNVEKLISDIVCVEYSPVISLKPLIKLRSDFVNLFPFCSYNSMFSA